MNNDPTPGTGAKLRAGPQLDAQVNAKAARKLKARRDDAPGVLFGLGMMGLIGWTVVVPTLLGTAVGVWLDKDFPGKHPWTLAMMAAGLCVGCLNAWYWVANEYKAMHEEEETVAEQPEAKKHHE